MKLVIFDLDGTLLNTIEDLGSAVNAALEASRLPVHPLQTYPEMVGHGVRNLVINALPENLKKDSATVDSVLAKFIEYYSSHIDVHTRPYPGIHGLLSSLSSKGYALAVASNKFQSGAQSLIDEFFPDISFVEVLGNRSDAPLKPSPDIVFSLMRKAGMADEDRRNVVMVGDSATDIKTAANAGVKSIAVSWGYRPASDLGAADFIANTVEELGELIDKELA